MLDTYGREVVDFLTNVRDMKIYTREEYEKLREYYKAEYKDTFEAG